MSSSTWLCLQLLAYRMKANKLRGGQWYDLIRFHGRKALALDQIPIQFRVGCWPNS